MQMREAATANYSLSNIFQKTISFIGKYPIAFLKILINNFLFGIITFTLFIVALLILVFMGFPMTNSANLNSNFSNYIFFLPIYLFFDYASFKALRIIGVSIYKKYIYQDTDKESLFSNFFKIYFLILKEFFALDILVIFILISILEFFNLTFFSFAPLVGCIYIAITRVYKLIKLQCLPFTYKFENHNDSKSLLERVYKLPLRSVFLMNFYDLVFLCLNILPFIVLRLLIGEAQTKSFIANNSFYLSMIFLSALVVGAFGDLASSIYYDIRSKTNFQKTTNIIGSLFLGLLICIALLTIYSYFYPQSS